MLVLWMLAVTSLAVYSAAAPPYRAGIEHEQYLIDETPGSTRTIQCYQCDAGEGDCNRNNLFLCEPKHYICGTLARSPNFSSILGCVTAKPKICSLTYTRANNELEFSCFCTGQTCNAIFNEEMRKDLLKFYADFPKYVNLINGSDYTSLFYEMVGKRAPSAYSEVTLKWHQEVDTEVVHQPNGADSSVGPHVIYANDACAEALRQDATAPASDDEDDGEGSGAGIVSAAGSGVVVVVPNRAGADAGAAAATPAEPSSPLTPSDPDAASPPIVPAAFLSFALALILILL